MTKYVIESVESKRPGYVNRWHKKVKGKHCTIERLECCYTAWFMIENLVESEEASRFHTSPVQEIRNETGAIIIETWNSIYKLKECK